MNLTETISEWGALVFNLLIILAPYSIINSKLDLITKMTLIGLIAIIYGGLMLFERGIKKEVKFSDETTNY